MSWCFADEATPYSRAVLAALENTYAIVPALWPFEIGNALVSAERRNRISQQGVAEFLHILAQLPIQIERRETLWLWHATLELARSLRLTAYDAAYLDLARRERLSLATLDEDLVSAAHTIGIPVFAV